MIFGCLTVPETAAAQKKGSAAGAAPGASTPGGSPAAPQGQGASNAPFEVEMLSYASLDQIMDKLTSRICKTGASKVVILDPPTLQNLESFDSFYANAEAIKTAFSAMTSAGGTGGGIDDFADITNAVATVATASTSETSYTFSIQDPTAAIVLLNHLRSSKAPGCTNVYYAGVYEVNDVNGATTDGTTPLNDASQELAAVAKTRNAALSEIVGQPPAAAPSPAPPPAAPPPAAAAPSAPAAPPSGGPPPSGGGASLGGAPIAPGAPAAAATPCSATWTLAAGSTAANPVYTISSQDPCIAAFNNLDGTYNSFLAGLSTPNATTGQPLLSSILQGYRLRALLQTASSPAVPKSDVVGVAVAPLPNGASPSSGAPPPGETSPAGETPPAAEASASPRSASDILGIYLSIAAAGGTQQDRKNLLTALFTGDWIRYSGGVSVNVIVFHISGKSSEILYSNLLRFRTPLTKIKKPKSYNEEDNAGDNLKDLR